MAGCWSVLGCLIWLVRGWFDVDSLLVCSSWLPSLPFQGFPQTPYVPEKRGILNASHPLTYSMLFHMHKFYAPHILALWKRWLPSIDAFYA